MLEHRPATAMAIVIFAIGWLAGFAVAYLGPRL